MHFVSFDSLSISTGNLRLIGSFASAMPHYENEPLIDTNVTTGDWRDQLFRDGYVVVKGVITPEKAQTYVDRMFQWLETFPYGFKANDPSTWGEECLPAHIKYDITLLPPTYVLADPN